MSKALTLYQREGCHLCEQFFAELQALRPALDFDLTVVDVDSDAQLRARFGWDVPVLSMGGKVICCHFLDPESLRQQLLPV